MGSDPFIVGVQRLRRQHGAQVHVVAEGPFDPDRELRATAPGESEVPEGAVVRFDGQLESIPGGIVVRGRVSSRWRGTCRRCATTVGGSIGAEVSERFIEGLSASDEEAYPLAGDLLDLGPMLRDAVVLELPLAPLCREDCQGLCVDCGTDLNAGPCGCEAPTDPRWATLDVLRPAE